MLITGWRVEHAAFSLSPTALVIKNATFNRKQRNVHGNVWILYSIKIFIAAQQMVFRTSHNRTTLIDSLTNIVQSSSRRWLELDTLVSARPVGSACGWRWYPTAERGQRRRHRRRWTSTWACRSVGGVVSPASPCHGRVLPPLHRNRLQTMTVDCRNTIERASIIASPPPAQISELEAAFSIQLLFYSKLCYVVVPLFLERQTGFKTNDCMRPFWLRRDDLKLITLYTGLMIKCYIRRMIHEYTLQY